jgi:hypothetical protein
MKKIIFLAVCIALQTAQAQTVIFYDNFDDPNNYLDTTYLRNQGYKYFDRSSGGQINGLKNLWSNHDDNVLGIGTFYPNYEGSVEYMPSHIGAAGWRWFPNTGCHNLDVWLVMPAKNIQLGDSMSFREACNSGYPWEEMFRNGRDSLTIMYSSVGDSTPEGLNWIKIDSFKSTRFKTLETDPGEWGYRGYLAPASGVKARWAIRYKVSSICGNNISSQIAIDVLTLKRIENKDISSVGFTITGANTKVVDAISSIVCRTNSLVGFSSIIRNSGVQPIDFSLNPAVLSATLVGGNFDNFYREIGNISVTSGILQANRDTIILLTNTFDLNQSNTYVVQTGVKMVGDAVSTNNVSPQREAYVYNSTPIGFNLPEQICQNTQQIDLSRYVNRNYGITFAGLGVNGKFFNPLGLSDYVEINAYDQYSSCTVSVVSKIIHVVTVPNANITTHPGLCVNSSPISLTGFASPSNGTFTGIGVNNNVFNPLNRIGSNSINYIYKYYPNITLNPNFSCLSNSQSFSISVITAPAVSFTLPNEICQNSPLITLSGTPSGGTFSGMGVVGNAFNSSTLLGAQTISYRLSIDPQCESLAMNVITITKLMLPDYQPVCSTSEPITLTGGLPIGGTYSGNGVSNGVFYSSETLLGIQTITYTGNGVCTNNVTANITVLSNLIASLPSYQPICENIGTYTLSGANPAGGIFSGNSIVNNVLYPSNLGGQLLGFNYVINQHGCVASTTGSIIILTVPAVQFNSIVNNLCSNGLALSLTGVSPTGGVFTGNGVKDGFLFPNSFSGSTTVSYSYTGANGCTNTINQTIFNTQMPVLSILGTVIDSICNSQRPIQLLAAPTGGVFYGAGVQNGFFSPAGLSGEQTITYLRTESQCLDSISVKVLVKNCTDIKSEIENIKLNVYPNPASSSWTLEISSFALGNTLFVYNSQGELVYNQKLNDPKTSIEHSLPKGIYLLRVLNSSKKLVIE